MLTYRGKNDVEHIGFESFAWRSQSSVFIEFIISFFWEFKVSIFRTLRNTPGSDHVHATLNKSQVSFCFKFVGVILRSSKVFIYNFDTLLFDSNNFLRSAVKNRNWYFPAKAFPVFEWKNKKVPHSWCGPRSLYNLHRRYVTGRVLPLDARSMSWSVYFWGCSRAVTWSSLL